MAQSTLPACLQLLAASSTFTLHRRSQPHAGSACVVVGGSKLFLLAAQVPNPSRAMVWKELREEIALRKGESRERVGWYVYDWADQAFVSVVISLFGPLFVNLMATEHAFAGAVTPSCNASVTCVTDRTSFLSGTGSCTYDGALLPSDCRVCVQGEGTMMWNGTSFVPPPKATVWFFGDWEPVSMSSWTISLSVIVQVVVFITFGAWADYGTIRHRGLIIATVVACIADRLKPKWIFRTCLLRC